MYLRNPSTKKTGGSFSEAEKLAVWNKASVIPNQNPQEYRKDACGALISWNLYGNTNSKYGWEIDHITPVAKGGGDELSNLQPLQWENNRHKSDSLPGYWSCKIAS